MGVAPVRVLVVGDPYFEAADFLPGMASLGGRVALSQVQIETTRTPPARTRSERGLREYAGDPDLVTAAAAGHQVLVVHGAPVSAETLATPGLRLVCCARGGPVNVDVAAATSIGIPVCGTPGKNAEAVAELTIAFALMLIRGVAPASRDLASGEWRPDSVFDGRRYFGAEASGTTLGLIGLGQVGRQVARRAAALGFRVLAHDPYADPAAEPGVVPAGLDEVLVRADVVSLHARATGQNRHLMGAAQFAAMRPGTFFINTAREQLVDEAALLAAVRSGRLAGAALDVLEPAPPGVRHPLLGQARVVVTPHIGGATTETLRRGAEMASASILAMIEGRALPHLVNPEVLPDLATAGGAS
jgi:D-3-phosphoglycerate dehydrogenase / 2-oxoglutarate reductase